MPYLPISHHVELYFMVRKEHARIDAPESIRLGCEMQTRKRGVVAWSRSNSAGTHSPLSCQFPFLFLFLFLFLRPKKTPRPTHVGRGETGKVRLFLPPENLRSSENHYGVWSTTDTPYPHQRQNLVPLVQYRWPSLMNT